MWMDWPQGVSGRDALAPSSPCGVVGHRTLIAEPRDAALPRLGPQEGQQVGVDLILMRGREAVRCARIVDFLRALDEPGRFLRRVLDGNDLVALTVHDQGRDIELLEVLGEVGLGEGLDAFVGVLEAGLHAPEPELIQRPLRDFGVRPIGAIEHWSQVLVELRAVLGDATPQVVEYLHRQALRIGRGLQHDRRHRGDEDRFGDPLRSMATDVAGDFAAAGGVADERGLREIERFDDGCKIVGIAVHVVPRRGLAGPAMAATVVRDHAESVLREEQHLAVPSVGAQRPAVRERYDRAFAPVLVVEFGAVLSGDRAHSMNFSFRD